MSPSAACQDDGVEQPVDEAMRDRRMAHQQAVEERPEDQVERQLDVFGRGDRLVGDAALAAVLTRAPYQPSSPALEPSARKLPPSPSNAPPGVADGAGRRHSEACEHSQSAAATECAAERSPRRDAAYRAQRQRRTLLQTESSWFACGAALGVADGCGDTCGASGRGADARNHVERYGIRSVCFKAPRPLGAAKIGKELPPARPPARLV